LKTERKTEKTMDKKSIKKGRTIYPRSLGGKNVYNPGKTGQKKGVTPARKKKQKV